MNRSILITGAGSGIGKGLALQLASRGHRVIVSDLSADAAQQVAGAIHASGGSALAATLDVTDAAAAQALLAAPSTGPVEVLINNAGLQQVARLEDFPAEKWQLLVNVMLVGAANMMRAALPGMQARGFGRIVNIGSIHSLVASPFKSAYVAAKHGLVGLSRSVALETADTDITVNTICPAYVRTPLVDRQIAAQAQEHRLPEEQVIREIMLKPMPKKSFVEIDEIRTAVEFFMSDAARNVTAQTLAIDGGWTAQ